MFDATFYHNAGATLTLGGGAPTIDRHRPDRFQSCKAHVLATIILYSRPARDQPDQLRLIVHDGDNDDRFHSRRRVQSNHTGNRFKFITAPAVSFGNSGVIIATRGERVHSIPASPTPAGGVCLSARDSIIRAAPRLSRTRISPSPAGFMMSTADVSQNPADAHAYTGGGRDDFLLR